MPKSKNTRQPQAKPLKFEPVPVTPIPCSLEELEIHLRGFITGFIAEEAQKSWLDYLVEKRSLWFALDAPPSNMKVMRKADGVLNAFYFQEEYATPIEGQTSSRSRWLVFTGVRSAFILTSKRLPAS